jgi:hypothetical protein
LWSADFQLFDNGKPQYIARFTMETAAAKYGGPARAPSPRPSLPTPSTTSTSVYGELTRARDAEGRQIDMMRPTDDRDLLHESLAKLRHVHLGQRKNVGAHADFSDRRGQLFSVVDGQVD